MLQIKLFDLAAESVKSDLEVTSKIHNGNCDITPDFENYSQYKRKQQYDRRKLLLDRIK